MSCYFDGTDHLLKRVHANRTIVGYSLDVDIRQIGQQLNVKTILAGSVRIDGSRVRITVQLSDASNGYPMWSDSYDSELKDIFDVQRGISHSVVTSLGVELSGTAAQTPVNPEAYQDYVKAFRAGTNKLLRTRSPQSATVDDVSYLANPRGGADRALLA